MVYGAASLVALLAAVFLPRTVMKKSPETMEEALAQSDRQVTLKLFGWALDVEPLLIGYIRF